jgi:hypothetical protein
MLLILHDINEKNITKRPKSPSILTIDFFNSMGSLVALCQEEEETEYASIVTVKETQLLMIF